MRQYCNLSRDEIFNLTPRETQIEFESYLKIQEHKFNIHKFYDNHFAYLEFLMSKQLGVKDITINDFRLLKTKKEKSDEVSDEVKLKIQERILQNKLEAQKRAKELQQLRLQKQLNQ